MKRLNCFLGALLTFFLLTCNLSFAAWYDYDGITRNYNKPNPSKLEIALDDPYDWTPGDTTLFSLDVHGGWDVGYEVLFDLDAGEGIDVDRDGYSSPQLMSKFNLKFGSKAWLKLTSPGVDIEFWCLDDPIVIDLLGLLGVNANVDLLLEVPKRDFVLPFLKDGSSLIDINFSEGIYSGDYTDTIYYDLSSIIFSMTGIPGIHAKVGTALGLQGGLRFGLDRIRYYNGAVNMGEQNSAYSGVDVSGYAGETVNVSKRDYDFKTEPYVEAGVALYLGFSISAFTIEVYTIDVYWPSEDKTDQALFSKKITTDWPVSFQYEESKTYSVPSTKDVVYYPYTDDFISEGGPGDPTTSPPSSPLEEYGLTVTNPQAGTRWRQRDTLYVGWNYPFNYVLTIQLWQNGQYVQDIETASGRDEFDLWKIPDSISTGDGYQVKVIAPDGDYGFSGLFSIIEKSSTSDPIPISSCQDFMTKFTDENGNYYLTSDIDCKGAELTPIFVFKGNLDGRGHTIENFDIKQQGSPNVGIFRTVESTAVIKNLTIEDAKVYGKSTVGLIAGTFVGQMENVHSRNCYIKGDEYANGSRIGGLVGVNDGKIILSSVTGAEGDTLVHGYGDDVGGIAGQNSHAESVIKYSWVIGDAVRANSNSSYFVTGIGGITGNNYGTIQESYTNIRFIYRESYVGGIAGENYGSIIDSFSLSGVDADNNSGGIAGKNEGSISRSYAAGLVDDSVGGGLVGKNYGVVDDSLWDTQTTGKSSGCSNCTLDNSFGKTTTEMKQEATYTALGWDFENVWQIDEGIDYPKLRATGLPRSKPTGVEVKYDDPLSFTVSWNSDNEVSFYRVYRTITQDGTPLGSSEPITLWISENFFKDFTALPGIEYLYTVRSARTSQGIGVSEDSDPVIGYRPKLATIIVELSFQSLSGDEDPVLIDGADWHIDGEGSYKSLEEVTKIIRDEDYVISFSELEDWVAPDTVLVTATEPNKTIKVSAKYTLPTGMLRIDSATSGINENGGRWRLEGSLWRNFGEIVEDITVGTHQIEFLEANGYSTPANITVGITENTLTVESVQYSLIEYDSDKDGLPDEWEQQIIDADTDDGITSVEDVLSGDDFDNDGLTNIQEAGYLLNASELSLILLI